MWVLEEPQVVKPLGLQVGGAGMGWGLGRLRALWFSGCPLPSPPMGHHILQSFVSKSAPSCLSPRRHPDCLPCGTGTSLLTPCFFSCGLRRTSLLADVCFFEASLKTWGRGDTYYVSGSGRLGELLEDASIVSSPNRTLIDFVESMWIGGPQPMSSVCDNPSCRTSV